MLQGSLKYRDLKELCLWGKTTSAPKYLEIVGCVSREFCLWGRHQCFNDAWNKGLSRGSCLRGRQPVLERSLELRGLWVSSPRFF